MKFTANLMGDKSIFLSTSPEPWDSISVTQTLRAAAIHVKAMVGPHDAPTTVYILFRSLSVFWSTGSLKGTKSSSGSIMWWANLCKMASTLGTLSHNSASFWQNGYTFSTLLWTFNLLPPQDFLHCLHQGRHQRKIKGMRFRTGVFFKRFGTTMFCRPVSWGSHGIWILQRGPRNMLPVRCYPWCTPQSFFHCVSGIWFHLPHVTAALSRATLLRQDAHTNLPSKAWAELVWAAGEEVQEKEDDLLLCQWED